MAKFSKGDLVIDVNTDHTGSIVRVLPLMRGKQMYEVLLDGAISTILESNIVEYQNLDTAFSRMEHGVYGSYLEFSKINTSFKIHNAGNNTISTLKASKTMFKPYQFKPLLKFLESPNRRILIADEVGLGKTIEAGHIMLELKARRELRNVLIICPKSLQGKWRDEMREKYNLIFKVYDRKPDLLEDVHNGAIKGIVSYERMRFNEKQADNEQAKEQLVESLLNAGVKFDLILCDEAHRIRNSTTLAYKGISMLMESAKAVALVTATPIMIGERNLFNLLRLLDSQKYSDYDAFSNELSVNRPFITALTKLNHNVPLKEIAEELLVSEVHINQKIGDGEWERVYADTKTIAELFEDVPLFQKIVHDLTKETDSPKLRALLQGNLSAMSEMNNIFSRTRKKEITTDESQAVRDPHTEIVTLYNEERAEFDDVIDSYIQEHGYEENGHQKISQTATLGLVIKKKMISSSVYGYLNDKDDLQHGYDRFSDQPDAKFEKLLEIFNHIKTKGNGKIIVFALYKNTLNYLAIRLKSKGIGSLIIHGDIDNRDKVIQQFRDDPRCHVLLSSEVGSEGLDMQFCDSIVNYDLPWNPMVVEQRIGRIDRIGQKSKKIHIYNLIVKDSIQEKIYERLLMRIGIFKGCIGDLEAILDRDLENNPQGYKNIREWFESLENELYSTELTKEEQEQKIADIERAFENEKKTLDEISEGLTNTLTNDIYFKNEISKMQRNHQYITDVEIKNYIDSLIRDCIPTCQLIQDPENPKVYLFRIPASNTRALTSFIRQYQPVGQEQEQECNRFINEIRDETLLRMTFDQETAYNDRNLIFVNAYHPIVIAGQNYYEQTQTPADTFQFEIDRKYFDKDSIEPGSYYLAVYISRMTKTILGKQQNIETLIPIIFDEKNNTILEDRDLAERMLGNAQLFASADVNNVSIPEDIGGLLQAVFTEEIDRIDSNIIQDQQMRMETYKLMQTQRRSEVFDNRIKHQKSILRNTQLVIESQYSSDEAIKNAKRILPVQEAALRDLIAEKEAVIAKINEGGVTRGNSTLLSLNHVIVS